MYIFMESCNVLILFFFKVERTTKRTNAKRNYSYRLRKNQEQKNKNKLTN